MKLLGKINWPWVRNHKLIDETQAYFNDEIEMVKRELERKRIAKFLMVVDYVKGMSLYDDRPNPILLEDLEKRIEALEKKQENKPITQHKNIESKELYVSNMLGDDREMKS